MNPEDNPFIPLTFKAYSDKAMTYRLPSSDSIYAAFNLPSEVGEFLGLLAKERRDGPYAGRQQEAFKSNLKKELGDILWNLVACCADHGIELEEAGLINLVKLRDRANRNVIQGSGDER